jgi:hypothetical protein
VNSFLIRFISAPLNLSGSTETQQDPSL